MSDLKPATALDPNVWYQVTEEAVDRSYDRDFKGMLQANQNSTADDNDLHVWPTKRNGKNVEAYWQFQPVTKVPGRYAIRYSQTETAKQLSVCFVADASDKDTSTRPCLLDVSDDETQQWDISEWASDSTYRFVNVKNGTKSYMDVIPNGPVFLNSDVGNTTYQSRQHWLMTSAMEVNDSAYSAVAPGKATGPSTTATGERSSSASDSTTSTSHKGLSSGAIAGIAVGSVLGVTALLLAALFLWRSNKRKSQLANKATGNELGSERGKSETGSAAPMTLEDVGKPHEGSELPSDPVYAELPAEQRFELP
ncbi:hypothetical protein NW762_013980 [Fusarium torreyae]|uniref:Ricin B lectin domain-containing protein n=1 Tax=Fusarium torreyae TaxID=1237075 RepID=A0A9W8V6Y3_9HYPO|nr:hypothetical protein NW762_013980 [Fusarium torreyae]